MVLALVGELDMESAAEVTVTFAGLGRERRHLRVDLSALEFVDMSGLRAVVTGIAGARREGCELEVGCEVAPPVRRIIELTRAGEAIWPAAA